MTLEPDDPRHGTNNGYCNLGCRCDKCKAANTAYMRRYRNTERAELSAVVRSRAISSALKWVQEFHPDVWKGILDAEWEKVGDRRPAGRRAK